MHDEPVEMNETHEPSKPISAPQASGRLISLDALRGFDMFWIVGGQQVVQTMIKHWDSPNAEIINRHFTHVSWEGFRCWDLIMPLFLFVVGVAMPFSFNKRIQLNSSKLRIYGHILKRVILLFILGMIVQGNLLDLKWETIKFYSNTLQAIAAGYLIASVTMLHLKIRGQTITFAFLLILFWILMKFVPGPDFAAGTLEPHQNLAIYIDQLLLGSHQDGTAYSWILSSITFGATTLLGVLAGHWLRTGRNEYVKFTGLLLAGIACAVMGFAWGKWNFPIIKHLWTSSMVLYAGGWSLLLLALFYLVIDIWKFRAWAFGFKVIGTNAIFIYVAWHVLGNLYYQLFDHLVYGFYQWTGDWTPFVKATGGFLISWLILFQMYRKKIFIKV